MNYMVIKSPEAIALRGAIAIALGVIALGMPGLTFVALTIGFGAYAVIDGILALTALFHRRTRLDRGWLALEGVIGVTAGIVTLVWPGITALALIYVIAAWALATGATRIANAIRLRKQLRHEWLLILSGSVAVVFGILLATMPVPGIVGIMWAVGAFEVVFGILLVMLAARLRRVGEAATAEERREPRRAA
jgi:uncharacterized membrane protein HdeD (DUF308 family)